jgi:hypothetical protein
MDVHDLDTKLDEKIKQHLKEADAQGELGAIALQTGIAGGTQELRRIMGIQGSLSIMDRGMLSLLLDIKV